MLAGVIVPFIGFYQNHWTIREFIAENGFWELYHFIVPFAVGVAATAVAKIKFESVIQQISD